MNLEKYYRIGQDSFLEVVLDKKKSRWIEDKITELFFFGAGIFLSDISETILLSAVALYLIVEFFVRDKDVARKQRKNLADNYSEVDF